MKPGQRLYPGKNYKGSGNSSLHYQGDGNLVLYVDSKPVWASNTFGKPGFTTLQGDGNFVIYNSEGVPVWATGTFAAEAQLLVSPTGLEIRASTAIWRSTVAVQKPEPPAPTPTPIPPSTPTNLTRLVVESNKRWFANASGRFDYREISAFSLLSRLLVGEDDHVRNYLQTVRSLGFTVVRVILTLDGDYWNNSPAGRSFRCAPDMPSYWQRLDQLVQMCAEEGMYIRTVFIGAVEPFGGVWHNDRRDVWNGDVQRRGENFVIEAAQRLAARVNVIYELCNEPGQIGMRDSFDKLISLGRRVKAVAPNTLLGGGAVDGPNDQDHRLAVRPFDYVDAHIERLMGMAGFEWVKRTGEYTLIDQPQVWPDNHPRRGERTGIVEMPFISGEPLNFGELRVDGRNNDVERSPSVAFAYGGVSRSRQYNTNFHYDGGLWTTLPKEDTLNSIRAYMDALNAFPMLTDGKWRGHWSIDQGNYWNRDAWPGEGDENTVLRHLRGGHGPWRAFGCGIFSICFPQSKNWNYEANLTRPADKIAECLSDPFPVAIYKRR